MEVDEQPQLPSAKLQVAEQLSLVNRQQCIDGLHLDNDDPGHQKIQPITAVQWSSLVIDGKRFLAFKRDFSQRQLLRQTLFVSRFQQARSQCPVNLDGRSNDRRREVVDGGVHKSLRHRSVADSKELTWRRSLLDYLAFAQQTSEPSEGGRHADIPVSTTFRGQNHRSLERFRPAGFARLAAGDCFRRGDEETALAQACPVEGFRQMGATHDRATQRSLLPSGPGSESAYRVFAIS